MYEKIHYKKKKPDKLLQQNFAGDVGLIPGSGRCPGESNGDHSSILACEIPCIEEDGGVQFMGLRESDTT